MPVEQLYEHLAEHENLEPLFKPIKVRRLNDGTDARNGVGSAREMRLPVGPPFVETVTEAVPNERIVYRITKGSPLKGHEGVMTFSSTPTGSHLHYEIVFGSKVPGIDKVVAVGLKKSVAAGLRSLAQRS